LLLDAGPHAIAVRAPGHKTLEFDVKVIADRAITYRGSLESIDGTISRPEPVAAAAATIYFIPGCYLGNVPPQQAKLPATCDIAKLSTYKP
jgi:hypothetical protein